MAQINRANYWMPELFYESLEFTIATIFTRQDIHVGNIGDRRLSAYR
jgi:hypothetical protein